MKIFKYIENFENFKEYFCTTQILVTKLMNKLTANKKPLKLTTQPKTEKR